MTHQTIVFAATGAISSGFARAMAQSGATVWLAGHDGRTGELVDELRASGAEAQGLSVDALDRDAVAEAIAHVRKTAGRIDSVFNGIGGRPSELKYPQRTIELSVADFMVPLERIVASQFLTAREAGKVMSEQGEGAVVTLSATLSGMTAANMAGISAACGAVEAMTRALAGDFGAHGVRVNCVRGSAMPETRTIRETFAGQAELQGGASPMSPPPLGRPITVHETARAAAFLASNAASGITGQVLTVCAGQFVAQG